MAWIQYEMFGQHTSLKACRTIWLLWNKIQNSANDKFESMVRSQKNGNKGWNISVHTYVHFGAPVELWSPQIVYTNVGQILDISCFWTNVWKCTWNCNWTNIGQKLDFDKILTKVGTSNLVTWPQYLDKNWTFYCPRFVHH